MIKLLKGLRPFRWGVAAVLILVFLQSMGDLYLPTLMSDIVDKGIVEETAPISGESAVTCCWLPAAVRCVR